MGEVREGRHLAAIMFVDLVGYTARMQDNEQRAIATVRALWDTVRPILPEFGGREVDLAGDGMLIEFPGALAAVRCAQQIQAVLHEQNGARPGPERVVTRAGVHLGDIEHRDGRIYGDGVNIAARLLPLAPAGAIVVSEHVKDQLLNVLEHPPLLLGTRRVKNVRAPLELWCLPGPDTTESDLAAARAAAQDESQRHKWTFGDAVLDERALELSVAGAPVDLDKKTVDVLIFLLHHAGEVTTVEEICAAAWPGAAADAAALAGCIARIRAALGAQGASAIRAVEGFGYRFAQPVVVESVAAEAAPRFDFKPGDRPPLRPLWSLVERLGSGGHGEAWLARHDKTREQRVFKFALEAGALTSLKREITLHRVLKDTLGRRRDFVRILDWNLEEPPYFIESEYADAGNLAQWAERQGGLARVPLATRLDLLAQAADALAAAHSVGVLHKDLKPANVLVDTAEGPPRIRLADFGSGAVLDPGRLQELGITRQGFTRTMFDAAGSSSGTPLYFAPEIVAGQPFTVQSDIYALGVMLYQILVGDFHKTLAPGWELGIADPLLREDVAATAHGDPAHRLPDASVLAQRLRALETRRAQRVAEDAARSKAEAQQRALERYRSRRWWTAGISVCFALLLIGSFYLWVHTYSLLDGAFFRLRTVARGMEDRGELAEAAAIYDSVLMQRKFSQFVDAFAAYIVVFEFSRRHKQLALFEARDDLARARMKQGRFGEALYQYELILEQSAREFGVDDPDGARYASNYGDCLLRHGKVADARRVLEGAQAILAKAPDAPEALQQNTARLRRAYEALGLEDEAAKL